MYKLIKCIFLIFLIFFGIIIGSLNTVGQREYFNVSKENFENNINNDNHENLPIIVEQEASTKIAQTIDDKIFKTLNKLMRKVLGD